MNIENVTLQPTEGFSREIGLFLHALEDVREQWREPVRDVTNAELSTKILPDVKTIAELILHIAEAEYYWIHVFVGGNEKSDEIKELFRHEKWFGDFDIENIDIDYCLAVAEKIHQLTRETLAEFDDSDMEKMFVRTRKDKETHFSLRWILHHLIDHEATHKGQILMVKRVIAQSGV